jgi:Uma2 family endonuclease
MARTDPIFRSSETFSQHEFARWVETLPPGDLHHYELLNGSIVREPPAGYPHGEVAGKLLYLCQRFVAPRKLGRVFDSSQGFALPSGDTVEPDVSFVSAARWEALPKPVRGYPRVAPELVFEVLSPSTRKLDEIEKKAIYARNGVLEYVLVDPEARTLVQMVAGSSGYDRGVTLSEREIYRSSVLAGLEIAVGDMMAEE